MGKWQKKRHWCTPAHIQVRCITFHSRKENWCAVCKARKKPECILASEQCTVLAQFPNLHFAHRSQGLWFCWFAYAQVQISEYAASFHALFPTISLPRSCPVCVSSTKIEGASAHIRAVGWKYIKKLSSAVQIIPSTSLREVGEGGNTLYFLSPDSAEMSFQRTTIPEGDLQSSPLRSMHIMKMHLLWSQREKRRKHARRNSKSSFIYATSKLSSRKPYHYMVGFGRSITLYILKKAYLTFQENCQSNSDSAVFVNAGTRCWLVLWVAGEHFCNKSRQGWSGGKRWSVWIEFG